MASVWMDKKPVTLLPTIAHADITHTAKRRVRDRSRISVQCPDAVVLYNWYMVSADKGGQYQQYYRTKTKSVKCFKYLFVIDASINNSFFIIIFTHHYVHHTPEAEDILTNAR